MSRKAAPRADIAAGIPASIPAASISAELVTLHPKEDEVWHAHAVALDSEKDLDADW